MTTRVLAIVVLLAAAARAQDFSAESARNSEWSKAASAAVEARDRARADAAAWKKRLTDREQRLEKLKEDYAGPGLERETVLLRLRAIERDLRDLPPVFKDLRSRANAAKAELERIVDETADWQEKLDALAAKDPDKPWKDLRIAREKIVKRWSDAAQDRYLALEAAIKDVGALRETLQRAQWTHERNNLTMRSPNEITWAATRDAVSDLPDLVVWAARATGNVANYFATESGRGGVVRWALTAGFAIVLALLATLLLRRYSLRLEAAEEMARQQRVFRNLARFGRRAIHLGLLYFLPESATAILPELPEPVLSFIDQLARLFALLYLVWGVYRELLRPNKPSRAILQLDDWARRRISFAIHVLLAVILLTKPLEIGLRTFEYGNAGAADLLEAIRLVIAALVLSGIVFRKRLMDAVLPSGDSTASRALRGLGQFLRPFLMLLMPTVAILHIARFQLLSEKLTLYSTAILGSVIATALLYQVAKAFAIGWAHRVYGDETNEHGTRAEATLGAALFVLRFVFFLFGVWMMTWLADSSLDELKLGLDVALPFQGGDDPATYYDVIAAFVVLFFFLFGTRHVKELLQFQVLERTSLDRSTQYTIATISGYVILSIGVVAGVRMVFNLSDLGTIVAALSVGIGFGLQEIVSNFISGLVLLFERPIRVGDTIQVGTDRGLIRQINIRATTVQTKDNVFILVPNRDLMTQTVVNYGYDDPKIRLRVPVGVSYGADPEHVKEVLLQVAADTDKVLRHPVPQVHFIAFGDSSLNFELLVWIQRPEQAQAITSIVNFAIFKALKEAGIEIPFPQRDLHLRSGWPPPEKPPPDPEPDPEPESEPEPDEDRAD